MTTTAVTLDQIRQALTNAGAYLNPQQFTFSVPTAGSVWPGYAGGSEPFTGYSVLNAGQAAQFRAAIAAWDAVIRPDFTEVADTASSRGEIRAAFTTIADSEAAAYAYLAQPRTSPGGKTGDIWIDDPYVAKSFVPGQYEYELLLHEIGHAIGLAHPFENGGLPAGYENRGFTVMSYSQGSADQVVTFGREDGSLYAYTNSVRQVTPMVLDIAAAQILYGADPDTALGDTVWRFDPDARTRMAIYDAGGIDTIDASNVTRSSQIDLMPGALSTIGLFTREEQGAYWRAQFPSAASFITQQLARTTLYENRDNVGIAFATVIENAIGGAAADTLSGNGVANRLEGRGGADLLLGLGGDDVLVGGLGADVIDGGEGSDTLSYADDLGAVFVNLDTGRGASNAAQGDSYAGIENVVGSVFGDFIIGTTGINRIEGAGGDDRLIGSMGGDLLFGGSGSDTASYEENWGAVFVNLSTARGNGNAAEGDSYDGIENLLGSIFDDFLIGDPGVNRLEGGLGADTLVGGGGADLFVFAHAPGATTPYASANADLILDFAPGSDRIVLSGAVFGLAAGTLATGAFVSGGEAKDGDDRILYDAATGRILFDADGAGGAAAVLMATLDNRPALGAADFVIV